MKVDKWSSTKDGPLTESNLRKKLQAKGYNVTTYTYPPGTTFPDHTHSIDKIDAVLSGEFKMGTKEGEVILRAGDCLHVPKGTVHNAAVVGNREVVSLDATKD